jgi:hypothetical protein
LNPRDLGVVVVHKSPEWVYKGNNNSKIAGEGVAVSSLAVLVVTVMTTGVGASPTAGLDREIHSGA